MTALLDRRLKAVKWGEFRLGDLFEIANTPSFNSDRLVPGDEYDYVTRTSFNQGVLQTTGFVNSENLNVPGTWSLGLLQMDFFYRRKPWYAGQFVRKIIPKIAISKYVAPFFSTILNRQKRVLLSVLVRNVDETFQKCTVALPITSSGEIDFAFMESFMRELEEERMRELVAYLESSGLDNCELSDSERAALARFGQMKWRTFNVKALFGPSTRGKRLKGDDRIPGALPFVTAGEAEAGVSAFIGNDVEVFARNTTTIDMFGSAKYRNHEYGADDHVAVVHTEKLSKHAAVFVTAACHKAAHTGAFDYGRNFYAKDADALSIMLPALADGTPDWSAMELFMRAVQKLVVRDVVAWKDREITAIRQVGDGEKPWSAVPRVLPEIAPSLHFREYLPLYSLKAACGKFGDGEAVEPLGWVKADIGRKLDDRMFVVRAVGRSMEPKIRDGDLCVMRVLDAKSGGTPDKPVLVQHRDATDPETGGAYSIKRYASTKTTKGDLWRHKSITLSSLNPDFKPMVFGPDTPDDNLKVIAEFMTILDASHARSST